MRIIDAQNLEPTGGLNDQSTNDIVDAPLVNSSLTASQANSLIGTQPASTKRKVAVVASIIALIAGSGSAAYYAITSMNQPKAAASSTGSPPPAVTVSTTQAKVQRVDDSVSVTGSVSAWDPLSVGAEIGGMRITQVNVEEGDRVRKGQVLATLNSSVLKAQLIQAKARLASAKAGLRKAIQPNRPEEINALKDICAQYEASIQQEEAHLKEARVNLETAELNTNRWDYLAKTGAVSPLDAEAKLVTAETAREEMRTAEAKVRASKSVLQEAREKLQQAERGGREEDVDISKATIAETTGQIEQFEHQIEQTYIKAPDDGLVAKRDAHIGDITNVGTPLFSLIRMNKLELRAQVSDLDLPRFKPGQIVKVALNEDDEGKILGKVALVSPQVDQTSRLGIVRITLPAGAGLKPGMFVRGQVGMGSRKALTVPNASLITRNGESFVFTLSGDRAVSCPVKVGVRTDKYAEIIQGLKPNEVVINEGARFLSDRDVVLVAK